MLLEEGKGNCIVSCIALLEGKWQLVIGSLIIIIIIINYVCVCVCVCEGVVSHRILPPPPDQPLRMDGARQEETMALKRHRLRGRYTMKGLNAHHFVLVERKEKPGLLNISTSPEQGIIQLSTGGTVRVIHKFQVQFYLS